MQRILITGVAGMIGSHLLDRLTEMGTYDLIGIDNLRVGQMENIQHHMNDSRFIFHKTDVLDLSRMLDLAHDAVTIVHLAAAKKIAEDGPALETLKINVEGTENVFKAAEMSGAKVIFASTSDVYGMSPDLPLKEDGDLLIGPSMIKRWSYAVSKLCGEQLAYGYYKDRGVPTIIIRYFGAFSPRSSFSWSGGHLPLFIDAVLRDEEVIIHGDGSQTRSMAYVSDVVEGTILAMESDKAIGEIINIGSDEEMSVLDCARLVHQIADTGWPLKLQYLPFSEIFGKYKDIMRRLPDLTKAKELLGYSPQIPVKDAIKLTIEERRKSLKGILQLNTGS
jgi:UDP-glucose 4-epimerase